MRLQHGRHVGQHDRDRVSGAHAPPCQRRGKPACALIKLAIAEALRAWMTAGRSGWISALRRTNPMGVSGAKLAG
jgi:hypothetical protein